MNRPLKYVFILTLYFLGYSELMGQLNTDRPSQSDNSYTLSKGSFQNENGFQLNIQEGLITNYTFNIPFTLIRYGLFNGVELRLSSALMKQILPKNEFGFADLETGVKVQLRKHISYIGHVGLGNGNTNFSNGFTHTHKISGTLSLGDKTAITNNVGLTFLRTNPFYRWQRNWLATLVLSQNVSPNTFFFVEPFMQYQIIPASAVRRIKRSFGFDFGFAAKFNKNTQIDFSYGYLKNQPFINMGFSWGVFRKIEPKKRRLITPDF